MNRRLAEGLRSEARPAEHPHIEAVVALGANLGDRAETMASAIKELARLPLVDEVRVSESIESVALKAEGRDAAAPAYLNAVAVLSTRLAPTVLLGYLHAIELRHGRSRSERRSAREPGWEDRTLDLDLIAYGDVVSDEPGLLLPHPRAAERDFVLAPWLAIDPEAVLPGVGRVDAALERLRSASPHAEETDGT
jgi:2-amino-4-hydroxy-6-hydroxymethyldihydropteridine diphosphokinase